MENNYKFIKSTAYNLTETEIRYAMANSNSNAAASRFLGIHIDTYRRYAKMYIDSESGKTLWELHRNYGGKGSSKKTLDREYNFVKTDIFEILDGKHPKYDKKKLAKRLIEEVIFPEECAMCGFNERRITDFKVPLILIWKDGNNKNHKKDNLEFLCYNCYFLTYEDLLDKSYRTPLFSIGTF